MMTRIRLVLFTLLAVVLATVASAQTALTSTTLNGAIVGAADQAMTLTATTGFTATSTTAQTYALIDREIVALRTVNTTSKVVGITRGQQQTRAVPHITGATVWYVPAQALLAYIPSGQCTRSTLLYVPMVTGGMVGLSGSDVGGLWDCLGVTTSGQWTQTAPSLGVQIIGSTVASATSMTPTGTYFQVSGAVNPVNTIVVPAGWISGNCLALEPTGAFVTGTGGNISIATTAVVGKMLFMCWNAVAVKWNPSY